MKSIFNKKSKDKSSLLGGGMPDMFSNAHPFVKSICLGLILNFIIEILCRRSFVDGFVHLIESPLVFLYNTLIIILTLFPALFVKKQNFYFYIVSIVWLGLAIANCVLLGMRTTPLSFIDFQILLSALNIIDIYVKPIHMILIAAAILVAVYLAVIVYRKTVASRPKYGKAIMIFTVTGIVFGIFTLFLFRTNLLSMTFPSMAAAYDDYGFAYCFSVSVIDRGIDEPEDYSEEEIRDIISDLPQTNAHEEEDLPNIIFIQIESFFDPNRFDTYEYTEDPMPFWTYLRDNYPGGLVTVPSIGAGTANTEFEIISGMSLDYFGVGEYPYKTILKETPSESINYNLKELGYSTHAIHNHTHDFYDRNFIYTHLGFDSFTPVEYMPNVERNFIDWAKDSIIPIEVMKALRSTEGQDMVYAITVQAHGKYPTDLTGYEYDADYTYVGEDEDPLDHNQYVYLLSEMRASSEALEALINELSAYEEKTVLVMYGDHFPAMDFEEDALNEGTLLDTEYVIWSNYGLEGEEENLSAFQLTAHVLELIGINNGNVTKLHQTASSNKDYLHDLELLEYDMLYGERYAYPENKLPYTPTDLIYGVEPIEVTEALIEDNALIVYGRNFTQFSKVKINGKLYDTVVESSEVIKVMKTTALQDLSEPMVISVAQVDSTGNVLGETSEITVDFYID